MKEREGPHRLLADAIRRERLRRDQTQDEASAEIGTSQQTFGKWENGVTRPNDEIMPALARWLGMTVERVEDLRGLMTKDPRERELMRKRVEQLEERMDAQAAASVELLSRLERIATRLDALDPRDG